MMGNVAMFAAINTKVKALAAQLLTRQQFAELIDTKSYDEAIKYLTEDTKYAEIFSEQNAEQMYRDRFEIALKRYYISNFYKLSHYFNGNYKKLFKILFMRFEIEDLKIILRGKYAGKDKEMLLYELITYDSPMSKLNYDELLSAKDTEEVIEMLHNTKYYRHIASLVGTIQKEGLFRIEMALDFEYFSALRKYKRLIDKEDSDMIKKINGIFCDLQNLQWILRGKKFYNLQPEELLNYTIYDWYRINRDVVKDLCYAKDINEFYDIVETTSYKEVFDRKKQEDYLIEKEILSYLRRMYMKYEKRNLLNVSVVMSYLELSLMEIRDIVTILENKRYNMENEEAMKYIITTLWLWGGYMSVEKMKMVDIIGHRSDLDEVAKLIVLSETVHLVNAYQEISSNNFRTSESNDDMSKLVDLCYIRPYSRDNDYSELGKKIKRLKEMCSITEKQIVKENELIYNPSDMNEKVDVLEKKFAEVYDRLLECKKEIAETESSLEQLSFLQNVNIPIEGINNLSNFEFQIFKVTKENSLRLFDNIENVPSAIETVLSNQTEGYEVLVTLTPKLLKPEADRIFKSVNCELLELPEGLKGTPAEAIKNLQDKISALNKKVAEFEGKLESLSAENQREVSILMKSHELETKAEEVKGYTACTNEFFYLSGWIPESLLNAFKNRFTSYEERLIMVEKSTDKVGKDTVVPTKLSNSSFFKPFEAMVNVYGTPCYNELDPTKFLAITYMIIFGIMYGDLGQGLVFVLAGLYMIKKLGRPNLGGVTLRIGAMSCISGCVYGSFFGNETLIPGLINGVLHLNMKFIHPMESETVMPVLAFSVGFGVVLLLICYVLNIINSIKRKDLENGLFGKNGLTGLILYVSIIAFVLIKLLALPTVINDAVWIVLFVVFLVFILLKQPLANAMQHKKPLYKDGAKDYFVEESFGVVETILGIISNTLSFIRIGAFAINHAGLFLAFTTLGSLISGSGKIGVGSVVMFIIGNLMIIGLEGLIVFIQGLRLQFYEFFGKYYEGAGIAFEPIKLKDDYKFVLEKNLVA